MADTKAKGSTDTSGVSRNRFVVSLPNDLGDKLDKAGAKIAAAVQKEAGISVELSRAQVIQSLVQSALAEPANGSEAGEPARREGQVS